MKFRNLAFALVGSLTVTFAMPAYANTLTFQGVTFETLASGNTLQLTITNALSGGTGNWANINYLRAFEINGIGNVTGATLAGWNVLVNNGLTSAIGCPPGACFYQTTAVALSDSMTFNMRFSGQNLNFTAPELKVLFLTGRNDILPTGSLLSKTISPPVPEPETYAMMAVGLGVIGWIGRRKKLREAVVIRHIAAAS